MNISKFGYVAATGLAALGFVAGGIADLTGAPSVQAGMTHLGYPAYFATLLGAWKVLGALAIAAPRFPRLKEWAYAGMFFDLSGAFVSHATTGDPLANQLTPLVLLAVVMTSWALRPASRKLASEVSSGNERVVATAALSH